MLSLAPLHRAFVTAGALSGVAQGLLRASVALASRCKVSRVESCRRRPLLNIVTVGPGNLAQQLVSSYTNASRKSSKLAAQCNSSTGATGYKVANAVVRGIPSTFTLWHVDSNELSILSTKFLSMASAFILTYEPKTTPELCTDLLHLGKPLIVVGSWKQSGDLAQDIEEFHYVADARRWCKRNRVDHFVVTDFTFYDVQEAFGDIMHRTVAQWAATNVSYEFMGIRLPRSLIHYFCVC
jgi:hypothetical protein